ncbi:MAG: S1/P1 nuclease, partial [Pseudomonadota bacterium]|nr:S1/P1 nuclease [Pseudomonadota bacterium]
MPNLQRLLAALAALLLLAAPARSYWEYGHEAVAGIAWQEMRPDTRHAVAALLRQGKLLDTPTCPVGTIEQASVWADCIKPLDERFAYAYSWHYQNVDVCKPFDLKGPCKDGNCVSAQIERQARLLAEPDVPQREKLMALAFLVHFVGDLHQPMHAGDHGDL